MSATLDRSTTAEVRMLVPADVTEEVVSAGRGTSPDTAGGG
jgi:hypothetical protein